MKMKLELDLKLTNLKENLYMKLDKQVKDEIRKQIEAKLQEVPEGKRIHLDRNLLEQLLFNVLYARDESIILKTPVWSGEFLSKIDLSEISFEDVSWYISSGNADVFFWSNDDALKEKLGKHYEIVDQYIDNYCSDEVIDVVYCNTNADIDFKKSWEYKTVGLVYITNCNFNGTNLSKNRLSLYNVSHSDLRNTGIQILPEETYVEYTNLEGVNLSTFEIDFKDMVDNCTFTGCNLKNTGIRISNFSEEVIKNAQTVVPEYYAADLKEQLKNGEFDGCYINGVLIKSEEERKNIFEQIRMKYKTLSEEILENTISDIDEQIKGMK